MHRAEPATDCYAGCDLLHMVDCAIRVPVRDYPGATAALELLTLTCLDTVTDNGDGTFSHCIRPVTLS